MSEPLFDGSVLSQSDRVQTRSEQMSEDAVKGLEQAAFSAWVTLGEMLSGGKVTRAEWQNAYDVLGQALEEYKRANK